ncbi:MAG TPA: hypothetical protein GYA08_01225 [Chloroflexi bacterium]|nr:hypothetical protein [Chloroflexota bacterium]
MPRQPSGFHAHFNTAPIDALPPVRRQRFRRRFFVALFVGVVGLTGFMIVLAMALSG